MNYRFGDGNAFHDVSEGWKHNPSLTWTYPAASYPCIVTNGGSSTTLRSSHCWHEDPAEQVCCHCGLRRQMEAHGPHAPKDTPTP